MTVMSDFRGYEGLFDLQNSLVTVFWRVLDTINFHEDTFAKI